MRQLLTITITSLMLAGCAGTYDKVADAKLCKPSSPPDETVAYPFLRSTTSSVPARLLLGSGKLDADDTVTRLCIVPKAPDPSDIGLDHLAQAI